MVETATHLGGVGRQILEGIYQLFSAKPLERVRCSCNKVRNSYSLGLVRSSLYLRDVGLRDLGRVHIITQTFHSYQVNGGGCYLVGQVCLNRSSSGMG